MLPCSTARLVVRDWSEMSGDPQAHATLDAALPLILTEPVLRHLPPDLQHTGSGFDPQAWLTTLTSRNDVGVVMSVEENTPIGFLTLREEKIDNRPPHTWIGYLFAEHAWGQGYATELVDGVVRASRDAGGIRLRAGVALENAGSMRVLLKAGFVMDPESSHDDWAVYVLPDT